MSFWKMCRSNFSHGELHVLCSLIGYICSKAWVLLSLNPNINLEKGEANMKCHHWTVTAERTRSARLPLKLIINLNSLHLIKQVQTVTTTESIKAEPTCDSVFVNNLTREPCLPSHLYQLSPPLRWLFMQKICVFCPGKVTSGQSQLVCEVAKEGKQLF